MGYALAEAAARRGAKVIVVSGPVALEPPSEVDIVQVETAEEMRDAVIARVADATVVIAAAAVADFRLKNVSEQKIKRNGAMTLELEPTPDILAELAAKRRAGQTLVGFAAETQNVLENARAKLRKKNLDAIIVNDVSKSGIGFDSERNQVTIITADDEIAVPEDSKLKIAHRILDSVLKLKTRAGKAAPAR
jgi:phosphopantothenoylcysteine decarboxylase/phosphopantothenate--cysteine ligase